MTMKTAAYTFLLAIAVAVVASLVAFIDLKETGTLYVYFALVAVAAVITLALIYNSVIDDEDAIVAGQTRDAALQGVRDKWQNRSESER